MIRLVPIFLLLVAAAAVFSVRHRAALLPLHEPPIDRNEQSDLAAQLRRLTGSAAPQDKPWAQQFGQFVNSHPSRQWIVGRSRRPALGEQEAGRAARIDAAGELYPLILRRLGARRIDRKWVQDRLDQDVVDGRLDADRCAEEFKRPYGTVWTESVLLDVSPDRVDPLVAQYARDLGAHRRGMIHHAAIAGTLVLLTLLGYVVLNQATRGYFATRLRLAATAVAAACVLLLV